MDVWRAGSSNARFDGNPNQVQELISQLYSYVLIGTQFSDITSYDPQYVEAYNLYNMNEFIDDTLTRSSGYYDDKTLSGHPSGMVYYSPKMNDSIGQITGYVLQENADASTITDVSVTNTLTLTSRALFEDINQTSAISKRDLGELLFNTYHWYIADDTLSLDLYIPSYISG